MPHSGDSKKKSFPGAVRPCIPFCCADLLGNFFALLFPRSLHPSLPPSRLSFSTRLSTMQNAKTGFFSVFCVFFVQENAVKQRPVIQTVAIDVVKQTENFFESLEVQGSMLVQTTQKVSRVKTEDRETSWRRCSGHLKWKVF